MADELDVERKAITASPENSETPMAAVRGWVTPTRLFFVRNHFDVPSIARSRWRLRIHGAVQRPTELGWDDLQRFAHRSVFATVECAGNGRSFLQPRVEGVQWGAGAIAHAEWSGVALADVLDELGVRDKAVEAVFTGSDRGTDGHQSQPIPFQRSLPLSKAIHPDTLLATHMNGEPLEPNHGHPLRLIVPGWYGVASVKWLTDIELVERPFEGHFQTQKYTIQRETPTGAETSPVQHMAVKSEFIRPRTGESIGPGSYRVFGVAWAGEDIVAEVSVSCDGGTTWQRARLIDPRAPYSWTLWEYLWKISTPGTYRLMARAVSASGQVQPSRHDPLRGGYMINFVRPLEVRVEQRRDQHALTGDPETMLYDMNAFAEANASTPLDVNLEFSEGAGI